MVDIIYKLKIGTKVRIAQRTCGHRFRIGEIVTKCGKQDDNKFRDKGGEEWYLTDSNIELLTNKNKMKKDSNSKSTKVKAEFKVGELVMNNNNYQKSKVLAVNWDESNEEYAYTLLCQDDDGSINLALESDISNIEYVKKTVQELKEYYEENEGEEVVIVKK